MNYFKVLLITQPDRWTAASMYQATRLFASNMDAKMAQR
jgi:essential nuclear protein 1